MHLKTFKICVWEYMNEHNPACFLSPPGFARRTALKKAKVNLDILTDVDVINGRKRYQRWNMS